MIIPKAPKLILFDITSKIRFIHGHLLAKRQGKNWQLTGEYFDYKIVNQEVKIYFARPSNIGKITQGFGENGKDTLFLTSKKTPLTINFKGIIMTLQNNQTLNHEAMWQKVISTHFTPIEEQYKMVVNG